MFTRAPLSLVQRYCPEYPGPVDVYMLQVHLINKVCSPLIERYVGAEDVVVDLGCGSGTMGERLRQRGATVLGIDLDEREFALDRYPELNFVKGTLYDLPFRSGLADFVMSRWVFEHLDDPGAAIAEVQRILKPNGLALIIVPNVLHPVMMLSRFVPLRFKQWMLYALDGIKEKSVMATYYRVNTEGALDRHFHAGGFEKVAFVYSADPSYWIFSGLVFRLATATHALARFWPFRRLQMQMVGLYRKTDP